MNTLHSFLLLFFMALTTYGQVGIGTTTPHQSSILHLESTNSGFLMPRLTYAQKLAIPSPATGLIIYQTTNETGFWYYDGTAWQPFTTIYTFENGLTEDANNVHLGGTLIKNTTLDLDDYDLTVETSSTSSYPGEFEVIGKDRTIFRTKITDNYIEFGSDFPYLGTSVDGTTLTTIGGDNYTIDVVAGFQSNSQIGGSSIRVGSVEYFMDGIDEIYLDASGGFHPREDQTSSFGASLGSTNKRWATVYANNGVIQTSDMRYKTNITPLQHGLNEILQLQTFTYNWKNQTPNVKENKIGLSAQELLEVIPEVVSTHSWVPKDENGEYKRIKNDKLGVNYAEIIPVIIKAIQEQQEQINQLKQ